ncbi:MAG: hypothetical protein HY052_00785 [Proteobacteria bacterium]|nr:hypothetical protein [Pseudomonadota bacterium]
MKNLHKKIKPQFNERADSALKWTKFKGHDVHIVEAGNPSSIDLLAKAYKDVYEPAFPIAEERETMSSLLSGLDGTDSGLGNIVIAIISDNINTTDPAIKGIVVGYYYHKEDVGLLAYTATAPEYRNQGLGHIQVEILGQAFLRMAKKNGGKLGGYFLECNDPLKVKPEEDSFDPATRIKIFQKWGAKIMPIDYVQPPLEAGAKKCTSLKLLAYPHPETGKYPTLEAIKGFVRGIYTALIRYSGIFLQADPDYVRMMQQIDALAATRKPPAHKPPTP